MEQPPSDEFYIKPIPRSSSGRIPQWMIDEALGLPVRPDTWRSPDDDLEQQQRDRARVRGRWARIGTFMFLAALIGVMVVWTVGSRQSPVTATRVNVGDTRSPLEAGPTPGQGSHPEPLGSPPPLARTSDSYRFVLTLGSDDVGPVTDPSTVTAYDPCRPVHYVVRAAGAPHISDELITAAVAKVSAATGLVFVNDGKTDERPSPERKSFQPDRYGDRWAPVLIAWTSPGENPDLAGDVAGLGGSAAVSMVGGSPVFVTGQVELDALQIMAGLARPDGKEIAQAIIQHELAHVVGLDHVDDPTQLMYPTTVPGVIDFGDGDLTGLNILGRGRCAPEL